MKILNIIIPIYNGYNSTKEWLYLRKVWKEVAHQYDDEPEEMTQAINALLSQKEIIKNIFKKLKKCANPVSAI